MPEYRVTVPVVVTIDVDLDPDFHARTDSEYAAIHGAVQVQLLMEALERVARVVGDSTITVKSGATAHSAEWDSGTVGLTREETIRDGC